MKILNYGSMNIDNVYQVEHMIHPGETQMAIAKNVFAGGKGLNQSIAIAKAGGTVYHAGVVGEDGAILMDTLAKHGVDTRYVKHAAGPSGHTVIQVDSSGQNSIIVFAGENMRVLDEDIERVLSEFNKGDLLILQNELDHSPAIMRMASERGMTIIFNPSPVNSTLNSYPLACVDWFLLNEIEGKALTQETEPKRILAVLKALYPNAGIVLTLGEDGTYSMQADKEATVTALHTYLQGCGSAIEAALYKTAEESGLSREDFDAAFEQSTGSSVSDYVAEQISQLDEESLLSSLEEDEESGVYKAADGKLYFEEQEADFSEEDYVSYTLEGGKLTFTSVTGDAMDLQSLSEMLGDLFPMVFTKQ